jgi:hypothetical protein
MIDIIYHANYEFYMLESCNEFLKKPINGAMDKRQHLIKNAFHNAWCVHAYNLLTYLDIDIDDTKRRIREQVLTLTNKRTPEDDADRILTPNDKVTNFIKEQYEAF